MSILKMYFRVAFVCRMQRFGMSTYLYAPKDDYKHRLYWRELYCQDETGQKASMLNTYGKAWSGIYSQAIVLWHKE